jgi:CO/xanthine dehydrogenase Mo-binding subunit
MNSRFRSKTHVNKSETLPDDEGPYGVRGIGEPPILAMAPAFAKAISNAVGVRTTTLPITAEKVLQALREKGTTDEHR